MTTEPDEHALARRLMAKGVDSALATEEERELALHLVRCTDCREVWEGLQQAHPALAGLAPGAPPADAVDRAVHRATTVLRGEADPGPLARPEAPADLPHTPPDDWQAAPIVIPVDEPAVEVPEESPGAFPPVLEAAVSPHLPREEPSSGAGSGQELLPPTPPSSLEATAGGAGPSLDLPRPPSEPAGHPPPPPTEPPPELLPRADEPVGVGSPPRPPPIAPAIPPAPPQPATPADELEALLAQERRRLESYDVLEEEREGEGASPGLWLLAIACAVVLAVVAGILVTRGQSLFGSGGTALPSASALRARIQTAFTSLRTLKASFTIDRLSLYRIQNTPGSVVYSFSNGRYRGSIVYDRSEGYRQSFTLEARGREIARADVVQTPSETQSLLGTGTSAQLFDVRHPPLGPPDGAFRPSLGLLEDAVGTVVRLIASAGDLKVLGRVRQAGRTLYEVELSVPATELTRCDQIDALIDSQTYVPMVVRRSISRANAHVLGPSQTLTDRVLDTAFARHQRVTSEVTELSDLVTNDIVLPGDLALDVPPGVQRQQSDAGFVPVAQADLTSKIDFAPLYPSALPSDLTLQETMVFTGKPGPWGPGGTYPAPKSILEMSYFDGRTTIVVTERSMPAGFRPAQSPLQGPGLPVEVRQVSRGGLAFSYGVSPEVPPHVWGSFGGVFVMVTGYAPESELVRIIASMGEQAPVVPAPPATSPSPSPAGLPPA